MRLRFMLTQLYCMDSILDLSSGLQLGETEYEPEQTRILLAVTACDEITTIPLTSDQFLNVSYRSLVVGIIPRSDCCAMNQVAGALTSYLCCSCRRRLVVVAP